MTTPASRRAARPHRTAGLRLLLVPLLPLLAVTVPAPGVLARPIQDPARRYEAMAQRAQARLEALHKEAASLAARERTLLNELRRLDIDREAREAELARANAEVAAANADLEAARGRIGVLEGQLAAERPGIAARLVRLYKQSTGARPGWWLGVGHVRQSARAYRVLSALARADRDRLHAYQARLRELESARVRFEQRSHEAEAWQARAEEARLGASRAAAAHAALIASIDRQRDLTATLAGELEQAQARLEASLSELSAGAEPAGTVVLPVKSFQGALDWPVRGPLVGRFGREQSSRFGTLIRRNGVEVAAGEGTPARAVHEGRVAFSDVFSGYGRLVIVDHGQGVFSLYGYLQSAEVARGQRVDAGAVLGATGRSPGGTPALYFELRVDGRPVDPLQWLKRN